VPEIPKEKQETDVSPVHETENDERRPEEHELRHAPERLTRILSLQFLRNGFWVFPKETPKSIGKWMLGLSIVPMFVN